MARSGQSAALALVEMGADVTATDLRCDVPLPFNPSDKGIKCRFGEPPDYFVGDFELVVISPSISVYSSFIVKAGELCIPVWSEVELAYRLCPCPMVAITGTNGKTTVTTLVGEILKRHNPGAVVAGNIGIPLTGLVTELTESDIAVAEISSFQLETIAAFKPAVCAVLNVTPDHLDRHHTMEVYSAAKARIFENQRQNDLTVLNYDNHVTKKMKPPGRVIFFSARERLEQGVFARGGKVFVSDVFGLGSDTPVFDLSETRVMTENALAAVALSLAANAPLSLIQDVLRDFKGVPHRLEFVASINGVDFYNDSKATNVDAAIKGLEYFSAPLVLIAGGYDKKTDFAPWVKCFEHSVSHLILIGQTAETIASLCDEVGFNKYETAESLINAVDRAKALAQHGQTVLLSPACASFDMFADFEERGDLFKKYVNEAT